MPEITTITSESLQAEVRRLLPSQRGFGQDLEAQNVIVPIVDLTPSAEGSSLRDDLQTAPSLNSVTQAELNGAGNSSPVTSPGFYKYTAIMGILTDNAANQYTTRIDLYNGLTSRILHKLSNRADASGQEPQYLNVNGVFFLNAGEQMRIVNTGTDSFIQMAVWPIADVNGNLINPSGFSFE